MECEGIGPDRAESIAEWFADEDNLRLVDELRKLGLNFTADDDDRPVEGPADWSSVRDHGHARAVLPERGDSRARSARGEGLGRRVEEDDRGLRRRESREQGEEGADGRSAGAHRGGARDADSPIRPPRLNPRSRRRPGPAPARRGPGPGGRSRTTPARRSAGSRTHTGHSRSRTEPRRGPSCRSWP